MSLLLIGIVDILSGKCLFANLPLINLYLVSQNIYKTFPLAHQLP